MSALDRIDDFIRPRAVNANIEPWHREAELRHADERDQFARACSSIGPEDVWDDIVESGDADDVLHRLLTRRATVDQVIDERRKLMAEGEL